MYNTDIIFISNKQGFGRIMIMTEFYILHTEFFGEINFLGRYSYEEKINQWIALRNYGSGDAYRLRKLFDKRFVGGKFGFVSFGHGGR